MEVIGSGVQDFLSTWPMYQVQSQPKIQETVLKTEGRNGWRDYSIVESAGCPVHFPAPIAGGFQSPTTPGFRLSEAFFGQPHIHGIHIPINKTVFKF